MASAKTLVQSVKDVLDFEQGTKSLKVTEVEIPNIDVKVIRARLKLSQQRFANKFGLSVASIRNWEQGQRAPEGPARVLLSLIAHKPNIVEEEVNRLRSGMGV